MGISTKSVNQYRKWGSHYVGNQIDRITARGVSVGNKFSDSELLSD